MHHPSEALSLASAITLALFICVTITSSILTWTWLNKDEDEKERAVPHPYLQGNFAPIQTTRPLTPCKYTGTLPRELRGGQYVRNGGNPVANHDLGRDAHWFDGDGMLSGVAFIESDSNGTVVPHFANQFILTDVYLCLSSMTRRLQTPILPSITTLIDPLSTLYTIASRILRTVSLVVLSHVPGSLHSIKKISVANTGVLYHDGRALATCESGPPMRIALPTLDTIGWFNGQYAEGEGEGEGIGEQDLEPIVEAGTGPDDAVIGGTGPLSFMREWTTAHPRSDPVTGELLLFHSTFIPPFVRYSVIPERDSRKTCSPRLLNAAVPGIASPKMMHDFGVSPTHTIIMDLPLSLAPQNLARNLPVVSYDPSSPSRFGIFPRYSPQTVRWFHTDPCCIFHTANAWDSPDAVHLLACRLTSPSLIFAAGGIPVPPAEDDQCRLYYYQFPRRGDASGDASSQAITHEWALLSLPFEFPSLPAAMSMSPARYIYGCSSASNFSAALGRAVKIDALVRVDVQQLIAQGIDDPPARVTGCVDTRSIDEIASSSDPNDPVRVFQLPAGWYAQEPRFVPRDGGGEEDGWLLTYVFDESQLDEHGNVRVDAASELWIIDAPRMNMGMRAVVARVRLPQRVPYGLHGSWFSREEVDGQRPWNHSRSSELRRTRKPGHELHENLWGRARDVLISYLA
ncbi:hypothetical protein EsDP_00002827 [Epichloe bromicola]|uniref:Carotenoid oxygenase n=1 Tax=Epichloe bromicola TaxID=79588 RepID=A0ABQ0CM03_9HYPO